MPKINLKSALLALAEARGVKRASKFYGKMASYLGDDVSKVGVRAFAGKTGAKPYTMNMASKAMSATGDIGMGYTFTGGFTVAKGSGSTGKLIEKGLAKEFDVFYGGAHGLRSSGMLPDDIVSGAFTATGIKPGGFSKLKKYVGDTKKLTMYHEAAEREAVKMWGPGDFAMKGSQHASEEVLYSELMYLKAAKNERLLNEVIGFRGSEFKMRGSGKAYNMITKSFKGPKELATTLDPLPGRASPRKPYIRITRSGKPYNKIIGHHPGWAQQKSQVAVDSDFGAGHSLIPGKAATKASKIFTRMFEKKVAKYIESGQKLMGPMKHRAAYGVKKITKENVRAAKASMGNKEFMAITGQPTTLSGHRKAYREFKGLYANLMPSANQKTWRKAYIKTARQTSFQQHKDLAKKQFDYAFEYKIKDTPGVTVGSDAYQSLMGEEAGAGTIENIYRILANSNGGKALPTVGSLRSVSQSGFPIGTTRKEMGRTLKNVQSHELFEKFGDDVLSGMNRHKKLLGLSTKEVKSVATDSLYSGHISRHVIEAEGYLVGQGKSMKEMVSWAKIRALRERRHVISTAIDFDAEPIYKEYFKQMRAGASGKPFKLLDEIGHIDSSIGKKAQSNVSRAWSPSTTTTVENMSLEQYNMMMESKGLSWGVMSTGPTRQFKPTAGTHTVLESKKIMHNVANQRMKTEHLF